MNTDITDIPPSVITAASLLAVLWAVYEAYHVLRQAPNGKSHKMAESSYAEEPRLKEAPPPFGGVAAGSAPELWSELLQSHLKVAAIENEEDRFEAAKNVAAEYAIRFRVSEDEINQFVQTVKRRSSIELRDEDLRVLGIDPYFFLGGGIHWKVKFLNFLPFFRTLKRYTSADGKLGAVTDRLRGQV